MFNEPMSWIWLVCLGFRFLGALKCSAKCPWPFISRAVLEAHFFCTLGFVNANINTQAMFTIACTKWVFNTKFVCTPKF